MTKSKKSGIKQQQNDSKAEGKLHAGCRIPLPQEIVKEYSAFFGNSHKQEHYNFIYDLDLYDSKSIWVENTMDDEQGIKLTKPVGMKTLDHYFNKKGSLKSESKSKSPRKSENKVKKSPAKETLDVTLSQDIFAEDDHDSSTEFVPSTQKSPRKSNLSTSRIVPSDMLCVADSDNNKRKRNSSESSFNQNKKVKISQDINSKLVPSPKKADIKDYSSDSSKESDNNNSRNYPVNSVVNDKVSPIKQSLLTKSSDESSSESDQRSKSFNKSKSPSKVVKETQLNNYSDSSISEDTTPQTSNPNNSKSSPSRTSMNTKNNSKLEISSKDNNSSSSSSSESEAEANSRSVEPTLDKNNKSNVSKRNSKSPSKSGMKSFVNKGKDSLSSSSDSESDVNTKSNEPKLGMAKETNVDERNSISSLKLKRNQSKDNLPSSSDSDSEGNTKSVKPNIGKNIKSNSDKRNSISSSESGLKSNENQGKDSLSSSSDSEGNTKSVKPNISKDKKLNSPRRSLSSSSDSDDNTDKSKFNVPPHNLLSRNSNNKSNNVKNKAGSSDSSSDSSDDENIESKKLNQGKTSSRPVTENKSNKQDNSDSSSSEDGLSFKNKDIGKMLSLETELNSSNRHLARASIGKHKKETFENVSKKKVQDNSDSSDNDLKNKVQNVTSFEPRASSSFLVQTPVNAKKQVKTQEKIIEENSPVTHTSRRGNTRTGVQSSKHSVSESSSDSDHTPSKANKPDLDSSTSNRTLSSAVKSSRAISNQNTWLEHLQSKMTMVKAGDKLNVPDTICLEDITSEDEIYTLQCPNEVDIESLIGAKISLVGESTFESKSNGKNQKMIPCESFALRVPSKINLLLPSKRSNNFKLGSFKVKGSVVVSERCQVPGIDESVFSSTCAESSEEEPESKKQSTPLPPGLKLRHPLHGLDYNKTRVPDFKSVVSKKKKKHSKEKSTDEMICELLKQKIHSTEGEFKIPVAESSPLTSSKSKKKKTGVVIARNHISLDSEDEIQTRETGLVSSNNDISLLSDDDATTEERRKKKKKSHPEDTVPALSEEDLNIYRKKKKKKDKEKLIGQIKGESMSGSEGNNYVEELNEVSHKKKKRKHSDKNDSVQQIQTESPLGDELIKPKKKKKKDKNRE